MEHQLLASFGNTHSREGALDKLGLFESLQTDTSVYLVRIIGILEPLHNGGAIQLISILFGRDLVETHSTPNLSNAAYSTV